MQKTISITTANALAAFKVADSNGKELLTRLLGKEVFDQKITDRVKTYEDACDELGLNPLSIICTNELHPDGAALIAAQKLFIIARALNEGWVPDWKNGNEYKYTVWMKYKSGVGLSFNVYDYSYSRTVVGSRLCFKTRELAEYAGKQFEDLYRTYMSL